jgi:hypothetical protein
VKIRFEDNEILVDFNDKGWNPSVLIDDVSLEYYDELMEALATSFDDIDDVELKDCVSIMLQLELDRNR